jgi:uncharacterized protein YjaZ
LDYRLSKAAPTSSGELADGHEAGDQTWAFGCKNEDAIWSLFSQQRGSSDHAVTDAWLYSYQAPLKAPAFIGYWVGYRIVQSYYLNAPDKRAAIAAILHMKDFDGFLDASGYPGKKPPCKRIPAWNA